MRVDCYCAFSRWFGVARLGGRFASQGTRRPSSHGGRRFLPTLFAGGVYNCNVNQSKTNKVSSWGERVILVEPMAARVSPFRASAAHQSLHHFVPQADWSEVGLLSRVREYVLPRMTAAGAAGGVDRR